MTKKRRATADTLYMFYNVCFVYKKPFQNVYVYSDFQHVLKHPCQVLNQVLNQAQVRYDIQNINQIHNIIQLIKNMIFTVHNTQSKKTG